MTITAEDLVRREVHYCVSALVSTLANGAYALPSKRHGLTDGADDLGALAEQALELAAPLADYEEAARNLGYDIRHDMLGFYACTTDEAEYEDAGNASVGFDGRAHFSTIEDAARDICEANDQEAYDREVYEHWIVSDWLADELAEKGEKVDKDFAGLTVWARTTTGQGIASDSVIASIVADINAPDAE
jgi:hypothetical protein